MAGRLIGLVALTALVLVFGVMDFRIGVTRAAASPILRVMTHNVGESRVTAEALDELMRTESVDVALLQECPFYRNEMMRFGWRFFYGGNLCLVSRFPFAVLDVADPQHAWETIGHDPYRFQIDTPLGRLQVLNVHLETIRAGLEAFVAHPSRALPEFGINREETAVASRRARERIRSDDPVVVGGDFNLPIESAIYRSSWGDLENAFSRCGRGFGYTKFAGLFGIRIDHVLTSAQLRCVDARVLKSPYGGDHAPLIVDVVRVTEDE